MTGRDDVGHQHCTCPPDECHNAGGPDCYFGTVVDGAAT